MATLREIAAAIQDEIDSSNDDSYVETQTTDIMMFEITEETFTIR